ncbi:MAG: inositol monophosphatase family protein [Gaiellaceae bacterium]
MHPDLAFALALADLADSISLPRFRAPDLAIETKSDLTPVTEADRAVERALRDRLATERPGEGVLGEELGEQGGREGVRWIVDPIDATRNFVRGIPIFATLVALERGGEIELGVASAPALGRRWWARRGDGAFANGERIRVSSVRRIEDAVVSDSHGARLHGAWHSRGFGDFWQHVLVAEGAADVAVDHDVDVWDLAALSPIVEEAGGRLSDLTGARRIDGGSGVSTNGLLHDTVLSALASA